MSLTFENYSGELLRIDGENIPEIMSYKVHDQKQWKNNDVNMAGNVRKTLLGVRPVINAEIGYTNRSRAKIISEKLNKDYFDVTYFDPNLNATRTAQFYSDGCEFELLDRRGLFKPITVTLEPVSVR